MSDQRFYKRGPSWVPGVICIIVVLGLIFAVSFLGAYVFGVLANG